MRVLISQLFTFLSCFLFSQIPPGYYNSAQGLKGNTLKVALHQIIKNHTVIPYSGLWSAFQKTDRKSNGKVWDIYSFKPSGAQPYEYTFVTHQCGSYNSEGDCFNREHTWPQSWFNSTSGPDSDMFHIYPSDGYVNNQRGNFPFGNVANPSWTSQNGSKVGPCSNTGYSSTVFEPINEFKGDLARSYFYMTTRYYSEDAGWASSPATNKSEILSWQLNVLMQWHHQDPVGAKEIARNDSIYYLYQNNRNPFIDNPAFADSIWASTATYLFDETLTPRDYVLCYPQPVNDKMTIQSTFESITVHEVLIYNLNGEVVFNKALDAVLSESVDLSALSPAVYIMQLKTSEGLIHQKLLKQ